MVPEVPIVGTLVETPGVCETQFAKRSRLFATVFQARMPLMRWFISASSVFILGCPSDLLAPDGGLLCTPVLVYGVTLTVQDGAGAPVARATAERRICYHPRRYRAVIKKIWV